MLERSYVVKFLVKEQNGPKEIHRRLKAVHGNEAIKWTRVHCCVPEVQREREHLSDSHYPRQPT
jgi:hypothetical protein